MNSTLYSKFGDIPLPYRVHPGRLSVSRTIGDIEAKLAKYGGNPEVVIPIPEVTSFDLDPDTDFIFLGCKFVDNYR